MVDEQPESHLPFQQRRAEPAHRVHLAVVRPLTCRVARALRPGTVDVPPPHVAGGAPVRPGHQLVPGAADRTVEVPAGRDYLPRDQGRRQLQGHHAADGRGLRPVRERQDRAQVQRRANTSRASACSSITSTRIPFSGCPARRVSSATAGVTRTWTDANGNFQPDCDLLNPLANDRRSSGGDFCGQISNLSFGQKVLTDNYDPALLDRMGRPRLGLEPRRLRSAAASAADVGRGRLSPAVVQRVHGERQPVGASRPTTRRTASRRPRIRGCPVAAAT